MTATVVEAGAVLSARRALERVAAAPHRWILLVRPDDLDRWREHAARAGIEPTSVIGSRIIVRVGAAIVYPVEAVPTLRHAVA